MRDSVHDRITVLSAHIGEPNRDGEISRGPQWWSFALSRDLT